MNIHIDDKSTHKSLLIDDLYKLFIVENVVHYSYDNHTTYNIHMSSEPITGQEPHYFVIDLPYHEAFAHWIFESAIYLPIFNHLKKEYSNIKLVLNGRKEYKTLFLKFFTISESDIVYQEDICTKNVCFFPSPISSLNDNKISEPYKQIVRKFIHIFQTYIHSTKDTYDFIVLPRQIKENYKNNDRTYNMTHIYTYLNKENKKYIVLNTDEVTDLREQITSIRSSSKIVLTDGSPFLVNSMFCMKSKIFIIGNVTKWQYHQFVKIKYLILSINEINGNIFEYIDDKTIPSL